MAFRRLDDADFSDNLIALLSWSMSDCYDMNDRESNGRDENDISDENSPAVDIETEIMESESDNFEERYVERDSDYDKEQDEW